MLAMSLMAALQAAPPVAAASGSGSRSAKLHVAPWPILAQDYPAQSLERGETGIVSVLLRVSADGRVLSCVVTETSGYAALDDVTCAALARRATFDPALDASGSPVEGPYRLAATWSMEQRRPSTRLKLALPMANVPADYRTPAEAILMFGPDGRLASCEMMETSGSRAVDDAACASAGKRFTVAPPRAAAGVSPATAVRYLAASVAPTDPGT